MNNTLRKRKSPRLNHFDYSSSGAYFITICTQNKRHLLSRIVGRGLAPAEIKYTAYGMIAQNQLLALEQRYPFLKMACYAIMPNHIHMLLILDTVTAGASPRPTVSDIICSYKSLTTRLCKQERPIDRLFQPSFYDHIIRDEHDYDIRYKYIVENPMRWREDAMYTEE